jgi:hypothetical protein
MSRPVNKDDLLAAYAGSNVDAVLKVLEAFLSPDAEDPTNRYVREFVKNSIKEIVGNLEAGKPPNADRAFRLKRENRRPKSTAGRNLDIAIDVQELRDADETRDDAIQVLAEKYCLGIDSIEKIYKKNKALAVRSLKACQAAGKREAGIQLETFWRDKLSNDALLLETILRHERSLIGRQG